MSFGFDPTRVFGDVRKDARKSKRKKKGDDMTDMMAGAMDKGFGLGIDTFSLATPEIDPLGIGEDFGEKIGRPAGQANGKGSLIASDGFLGEIGRQAITVPSVVGRRRRITKTGKAIRRPRSVARSPIQARSGSRFGNVDDKFGEVFFSNIAGARRRIAAFREGRRVKEDPPMLEFKQPATEARDRPPEREPPALEDKSTRSAL